MFAQPLRLGDFFMLRFVLIALLSSGALFAHSAGASPEDFPAMTKALERARAMKLHQHRQWRRLLQVEDGGSRSEVLSPEFFLAANGSTSPEAELAATIRGWFEHTESPDQHPRCRFPARYLWLSRRLDLPANENTPARCPRYEDWARLNELDSVSLLMVSGYLGNPASSFGHSLLKLNHHGKERRGRLLDVSFNFGALVPPHESTPVYIYRGLFGGYQAGFSDRLYYSEDQVYTNTEFRDIWEYELALTSQERELLVAHLWEIAGKKFTYYFLTKNCVYRMAELLTLATDTDFTPGARLWYAPVELFHALKQADEAVERRFVAEIRFIPSSQRVLYHNFGQLDSHSRAIANHAIESRPGDLERELRSLPSAGQSAVLEALLAYYQYRIVAEGEDSSPGIRDAKKRVLQRRLRLPPSRDPGTEVPALPPPTASHMPMLVGAGGGSVAGESRFFLHLSPYFQDLLSGRHRGGKELVALDTRIAVDSDGDGKLVSLDLIRLRDLQGNRVPVAGESQLSWQLRLGLDRERAGAGDLAPQFSGGIGRAWELHDRILGYALADVFLHGPDRDLSIGPDLGMILRSERLRIVFDLHQDYDVRHGGMATRWELETRVPVTRNLEFALEWRHADGAGAAWLGVNTYW